MTYHNAKMNQYDRQNRTFGIEAEKINNSSVYLFGLEGGLGSEVSKFTLKWY